MHIQFQFTALANLEFEIFYVKILFCYWSHECDSLIDKKIFQEDNLS